MVSLFYYGMLGLIAGLGMYYWRFMGDELSQPTNEEITSNSAYFSENYQSARSRFIAKASAIGASLASLPVEPSDSNLTIDVAVLRGDPSRCLLHISGTHGVEGYAGSAIQLSALDSLLLNHSSNPTAPTIILLHALNPYGFAHNRRTDKNNVDINRNFLRDDEFAEFKARDSNFAGYDDVAFILNPNRSLFTGINIIDDIYSLALLAYSSIVHGVNKIKIALVSGNYRYPTGLGFAGQSQSQVVKHLVSIVDDLAHCSRLILIDVHTGLGPAGVDSLSINSVGSRDPPDLEHLFPTERARGGGSGRITGGIKDSLNSINPSSTFYGYALTRGTLFGDFCRWIKGDRSQVLCLIQEIGTLNNIAMGLALVRENNAHYFGSTEMRRRYSTAFKDAFCLPSSLWKYDVVRRGVAVMQQGMVALMEEL